MNPKCQRVNNLSVDSITSLLLNSTKQALTKRDASSKDREANIVGEASEEGDKDGEESEGEEKVPVHAVLGDMLLIVDTLCRDVATKSQNQ